MEMTVVSTAMPTVVAELGGLSLYAWAFAAYMLATTVTVPIWGKLADLRGRKPVLLAGVGLFLLGSSACGWSRSMEALIAWRAVQGLGAGAMQPVTFTIVGDLFDVHERGRMQGLFGAVWGLAGLVGPLVGGAIVHGVGWRWIFWINLPFGLASAAVLALAYHERPEHHAHKLDVGGAALLAVGGLAAGGLALLGIAVVVTLRALQPHFGTNDRQRLRQVVRWAGFLLPVALFALAGWLTLDTTGHTAALPQLAALAAATGLWLSVILGRGGRGQRWLSRWKGRSTT
jgi:MFS family permease